ncbi:ABC transporter permease [Quadrisphaera sp. DSM 44207]|uniref:ABC transporter permease n=1 Tax=Quadrisphaera sp. DSM 44207 TaxID=1881057 RepID=UPI00088503F2|nr:ABC transporter permease subunit [Quadrisphaera sp. DSM 44207]SDQ16811.1 osmoprotectant transport system permease protein [Quadrisphaera sp. DSM 44207]
MGWVGATAAWLADGANWAGPDGVWARLGEHVAVSAAAVGLACLLGLPLALWLGHAHRGRVLALGLTNLGRAVPVLAVLVVLFLLPPPFGYSTTTVLTALVLFALPAVVTSAYTGVAEADPGAVAAARGAGMSERQVLTQVELPLAVPLLMSGVRLAAVEVVATATVAAFIAGPGLGRIINAGLGRRDIGQLIAGALLVTVLALLVEGALALLTRRLDPAVRARRAARRRAAGPRGPAAEGSVARG